MIKIPSSWEKTKKRQVKELTKILLLPNAFSSRFKSIDNLYR